MKLKKGFTLIELLVVVAIIGILATVVILNVASARTKAVNASMLTSLSAVQKTGAACVTDNSYIKAPTALDTGGGDICNDATTWKDKWPAASGTFKYTAATAKPGGIAGNTAVSYPATNGDSTFVIGADISSAAPWVQCTYNVCTKSW